MDKSKIKKNILISVSIGIVFSLALWVNNFIMIFGHNEYGIWGYIGLVSIFLFTILCVSLISFFLITIINHRKEIFTKKVEVIISSCIGISISLVVMTSKFNWFYNVYGIMGIIEYVIICLIVFVICSSIFFSLIIMIKKKR